MLRVVLGRARLDTGWSVKLSGLNFSPGSAGELDALSSSSGHCRGGITTTIVTMPRGRVEVARNPGVEEAHENPNISEFSKNGSESEIEEKV
jgi:hypothetical protein